MSLIRSEILNNFENSFLKEHICINNKPFFNVSQTVSEIKENLEKTFITIALEHNKKIDLYNQSRENEFIASTKDSYINFNISKNLIVDCTFKNLKMKLNNKGNLIECKFLKNSLNNFLLRTDFKTKENEFISHKISALSIALDSRSSLYIQRNKNDINIIISGKNKHNASLEEVKNFLKSNPFIDKEFLLSNSFLKDEDVELCLLMADSLVIKNLLKKQNTIKNEYKLS